MKRFFSVFLVVAMALSMVACTSGAESGTSSSPPGSAAIAAGSGSGGAKPLRVGLSLTTLTFPYYVRMRDQFMKEAEQRGWEVTYVDGNMDAGKQLSGLQDLVKKGVDVLVVGSWYFDAMTDVFEQCKEKGIPVFQIANNQVSDLTKDFVTFAAGTAHYDGGYLGGVWCSGYLKEKGKTSVNVALMTAATEQIKARGKGFCDGLKENGITVKVLNEYDASSREAAMGAAEDALTAYSDIDLFFGASAQAALGSYDATVGAKRANVLVMGYDGEDEERKLVDKGANYIGTITQDPAGEATVIAEHIDQWGRGETFHQSYKVPAGIYCAKGQLTSAQVLGK